MIYLSLVFQRAFPIIIAMPFVYSFAEKVEMLLIFGEVKRNASQAANLYAERFPERPHPDRKSFSNLVDQLKETGSLKYKKSKSDIPPVTHELNQALVLNLVENDHQISSRKIAEEMQISRRSVGRILKTHKYHPFHIELHQELHGEDFQNRVNFCQWAEDQIARNNAFFNKVLFTDECQFKKNGQVNRHNLHYWAVENPHWMRQQATQNYWSLNVWGGVIHDRVVGPFFFDGILTGEIYGNFLRESLEELLDDIPLNLRQEMWFQQDGAPPHFSRIARDELDNQFGERWIGRAGPVAWPPRSPDLTPPDFFLWGTVKDMVYREEPTTVEDMKDRIRSAFTEINRRGLAATVQANFRRRLRACIDRQGHHFEHFLI